MQVVMAIQDYISHDPKVNQFIKSLSEEEADEINRYIEENFSDGTLYQNDLEDGCLNGEFNAVLVKQGLREADSYELVNVCLVSSDYEDTASDLSICDDINGVMICCFHSRDYLSIGSFDYKLYENSDSVQDCMRQIEEEYGPCEFRALDIYDHSLVSFSASALDSEPSNDWDSSRNGLVYMPKKEVKEYYQRALKTKDFEGSYEDFVDAHFDMATERFSNLYKGNNFISLQNYKIPKFMYQQIENAYDKRDKLFEIIDDMEADDTLLDNVLTKEELENSVIDCAGKDCVMFLDDPVIVREKLYDSQYSCIEQHELIKIGNPLHEKQTLKQTKSRSR